MKITKITAITLAGIFSTAITISSAQAECNIQLPYEQLVDCIVVEGSGAEYKSEDKTDDVDISVNKEERPVSNKLVSELASELASAE